MNGFEASFERAGYGELVIIPELSLRVSGGEVLVILGSNGAGKTTALKAVVGMVNTARRRVRLDGEDLSGLAIWQIVRRGIGFVPDGARCFPNASVLDNLKGALQAVKRRPGPGEQERLFEEVFALFPTLKERLSQLAGSMSGGQRQMLAIARALMTDPRVLILDEPSAGLAPKIVEELFEALGHIKARSGCAIVMAEQNVGYAMNIADRCLVLDEGRVSLAGSIEDVRKDERLRVAYLGL